MKIREGARATREAISGGGRVAPASGAMLGLEGLAHCMPLLSLPASVLELGQHLAATDRAWDLVREDLLGLYGFHPGCELFERPILFDHDVIVEEVRDDVLDAHFVGHAETPAVTRARYFLHHPASPDGFRSPGAPVLLGDRPASRFKLASAGDGGHAQSATRLACGKILSASFGSYYCTAQQNRLAESRVEGPPYWCVRRILDPRDLDLTWIITPFWARGWAGHFNGEVQRGFAEVFFTASKREKWRTHTLIRPRFGEKPELYSPC
jgi:hypothetical protein